MKFELQDEYIELYKLLKVLDLVDSGAEAKLIVADGHVRRNDEIELRNRFIVESGSHDLREKVINWSTFLGYWPALYLVSRKFNGWGVVLTVTGAWYLLYRQLNRFNNSMLQTNLNTFASPLVSKYKIVNHHD